MKQILFAAPLMLLLATPATSQTMSYGPNINIEAAKKIAAPAMAEARKKVELLFVRINQLRDITKQEIPAAIGITLGFNELDGDGS